MGFFHQLRLLLWKNFTLKKRSPFVLLFEVFIPLVLFVILLLIRKKLPASPMSTSRYIAKPLPSAGLVSLLQMFCEGGERDEHGFMNFSNSRSTQKFLNQVQAVALHHNFFIPGFTPQEMDELPNLYRSVINDPAFLYEEFVKVKSVELADVLSNATVITDFLSYNLSLPYEEVQALTHSTINVKTIYKYLFGGDLNSSNIPLMRMRRSLDILDYLQRGAKGFLPPSMASNLQDYKSGLSAITAEEFAGILKVLQTRAQAQLQSSQLVESLVRTLLGHQDMLEKGDMLTVLDLLLETVESEGISLVLQPDQIARLLKMFLLSPSVLHSIACDGDVFPRLLQPMAPYNLTGPEKVDLQHRLCSLNTSQLLELSDLFRSELTDNKIVQILNLHEVNLSATALKIHRFLEKVEKFIIFQRELEELGTFVEMLPFGDNATEPSGSNQTATDQSFNSTDRVTLSPSKDSDSGHPSEKTWKPSLMRIWNFMQTAVCGRKPKAVVPSQSQGLNTDEEDMDALALSSRQKDMLGIIIHYLYSNPKIIYAPNNTAADAIIKKANATFQFVGAIRDYAREWLNVSQELREFLRAPETEHNLQAIKEMQGDLRAHDGVIWWLFKFPQLSPFVMEPVHNASHYIHIVDMIDRAAHGWLNLMAGISLNIFQGFESEKDMVNYFLTQAYAENVSVIAGVVFEDMLPGTSLPPHVRYKIRQNATFTPTTKYVRKQTWYPGPGPGSYPYYQFGFVWVQDMIERAVVDLQVGREVIEPGTYMQQFPYPCYVYDQFVFMIEHVMPLCLTISWVYSVAMLVQSIVYEKEHRLKEVMKMMGLSNAVHWCAWFLTTWLQMTSTVAILTAMLKLGKVLPHSEPMIIFIVLEVYAIAIISFSFLISVLYSKAKVAAACAGIIYFLSYVPYMYLAIKEDIAGDKIPAVYKTIASLFSTTAFGVGAKYFAFYEEMGVGVRWDNIGISPVEDDQYNLLMVTLMMVLDSLIYAVLVWYIEHVHPGSYGLPKPWYFPFTKTYWCGGSMRSVEECSNPFSLCGNRTAGYLSVTEEDQACAMAQQDPEQARRFDPEPIHLPLGVCIDNLTKVYKLGHKVAVKQLSLNLYEGQITSFLGHNGAGKTTTMSMLSGLIPPTQGYATIYGMDIRTDMDVIRQSLGMCPQHNVLFDKFTVEEHLWFYAHLKGMNSKDIQQETDRMIEDLGLPDRRHSCVDCLSGGMQRKLSVAIAFVGGSRTVILDEPTAGVDPYARRAIWDLLVKFKQGRTILLSTHHMDEADILGDRIAIISNGQLKCCGSSMFLKNNIGNGYHLILVKAEPEEVHQDAGEDEDDKLLEEVRMHPQRVSPCSSEEVGNFMQKHLPSAYLVSESARELHYILPFEEAKKGNFRKLFEALDSSLASLHVNSYGIMDTTLEEIFLTITEAACQEEEEKDDATKTADALSAGCIEVTTSSSPCNSSPSDDGSSSLTSCMESENMVEQGVLMEGGSTMHCQATAVSATASADPHHGDSQVQGLEGTESHQNQRQGSNFLPLEDLTDHHSTPLIPPSQTSSLPSSSQRPVIGSLHFVHDPTNSPRILLEGRGSHMLRPHLLLLSHFKAVIIKRFHYITRNWRSLFSQIILPAIFVAIAMTVALAAPSVDDLPPLELTTLQYYNVTQPGGNFIPITNERMSSRSKVNPNDAVASRLMETFKLASGIGASCVLMSPQSISGSPQDIQSWQDHEMAKDTPLQQPFYIPSCHWLADLQQKEDLIEMLTEDGNETDFTPVEASTSRKHYYPSCHCASDGSQYECVSNSHESPPSFRVITQDWLVNITGQRTEDYLLYTTYDKRLHRYGAISFGLLRKDIPENFGESAPTLYKKLAVRNVAKVWFNHKGYHSMPVFLNAINNAILRANLPSKKGNPAAYGITAVNHPWNDTNNVLNTMNFVLEGSDVLISIFIIVAMSFVPASFVVFLVYERSTKAKHLQFVTGINPVMYWIGNYTWDMANYVIPAFMCVMILLIFQIPAYVSTDNLPAVIALFLMYGWSITPVMYPASFWFNEPSTAYICLIVINLFTGITCIVSSFLLEIFSYDKDLERVHNVLKIVFMLFPNYCLGRGLIELAFNEYKNEFYFKTGQNDLMTSPMQWELIPRLLVAMASIGLAFFFITLLCEYSFFIPGHRRTASQQTTIDNEDCDVATERKRVLRGSGKYDVLRLENLTKVYKTRKLGRHLAVDKLCLGVPPGECFGLLGVNGAGKTTTFKMLTGDIGPSAGNAYLNGHSIVKDIKKVQQSIGYCPQFDCLYDELTAREHLLLYCRLRGVPPKDEKQVVEWALNKLGLAKYADKLSGTYSGGNKRKLSTAIALIGHPPVIFMDEPTTGMDPHSRRFLWNLILSLIQDGRSVILTSHSMEECEILCTRLAIMVNGCFQCLGSTQHLKNKFGEGYTFSIRVAGPDYEHNQHEIIRFIQRNIPSASLKEQHYNVVQYELRTQPVSLGNLFEILEQAQRDLHVEDYSVSQNTLDNVFINFVKKQVEIVRDEEEPPQQVPRPWLLGRSRARCQPIFDDTVGTEDVQPLLGTNQFSDSLELSDDDDLMLQLDQSDGTRLTLMPL